MLCRYMFVVVVVGSARGGGGGGSGGGGARIVTGVVGDHSKDTAGRNGIGGCAGGVRGRGIGGRQGGGDGRER